MAAFTKIFLDARRYSYTGLSTDTKPTTDVDVGVFAFETDTGNTYQFNGSSWDQISSGGAGHVTDAFIGETVVPETTGAVATPTSSISDADAAFLRVTLNAGDDTEEDDRLSNGFPNVVTITLGETLNIGPLSADVTRIGFDTCNGAGVYGGTPVSLRFADTGVRAIVINTEFGSTANAAGIDVIGVKI